MTQYKNKTKKILLTRLYGIAAIVIFLTSCTPPISNQSVSTQYYDPNGWYRIDVPKLYQYNMEEHTTATSSCVAFHDDMGGLIRFEVTNLCDDEQTNITKMFENNPESFREIFFDTCIVKNISSQYPGTKTIHYETIKNDSEILIFAFLKILGGGTLRNIDTGRQTDSLRGYLIFLSGNQLVIESLQHCMIAANYYKDGDQSFIDNTLRLLMERKTFYTNLQTQSIEFDYNHS